MNPFFSLTTSNLTFIDPCNFLGVRKSVEISGLLSTYDLLAFQT